MPVDKNSITKWQDASSTVNNCRWQIAKLLKSFSENERQTKNYKWLLKDIEEIPCKAMRDADPTHSGVCGEEEGAKPVETKLEEAKLDTNKDEINWKSFKIWGLIFGSPVIIKLLELIYGIISKGSP
jgi:hypothetical protein